MLETSSIHSGVFGALGFAVFWPRNWGKKSATVCGPPGLLGAPRGAALSAECLLLLLPVVS